ncbi:hypothetical protein V511_13210 [Mesotoga sp. Brook.08.YT.4.2.5.1]|nr:hypothetical protein V511_13210 [Mesotoga sp. Brook.08.YT.4.2.5.1]PNS40045.1 hypothetical protein RJ60_07675 [Mesotoga sp. B105.6.4]PVD17492.1 hypothetical protein V512_011335 [Mesotoga sp. Brook.08.105.5.1]RAM58108.1 hypothetical protein DS65_03705 [Mesotoga sp. SC_4PWL113PWK15]RAO96453.1 hypothetical protein M388_14440 [Mesotoga sp. Brook.08.YT.4.2.5.4.]RDI90166.1 hypothetical protein Q502_14470 [Mesotoga sp. Brook.08.YT.4.2.5.2.]
MNNFVTDSLFYIQLTLVFECENAIPQRSLFQDVTPRIVQGFCGSSFSNDGLLERQFNFMKECNLLVTSSHFLRRMILTIVQLE